ncbi:MAG: CopD family protein [Neisseria sp.]|nr:CopD family protein [Neisseria sp.]
MPVYLWLKLLHLFFVVSWFAGLFYLPRIYVNMAQIRARDGDEYRRLLDMSRRLYRFATPLCAGALVFGLVLLYLSGGWRAGWGWGKAAIGLFLLGYHIACGRLLRQFAARRNRRSHTWLRVFNEIPVLALAAALYLVIFKPF